MAGPQVSVLLPCRDAAQTLPAALSSLFCQSFTDFEVCAVDDGSTDATWEILQAFAGRDARLRPLRLPENHGIVPALIAAFELSQAPLLARMDADDLCLPRRLEAQVALLLAEPALGLVSGLVRYGGDRNACAGYARYVDWINTLQSPEDIAQNRFVESPLAHPSVLFRRSVWEAHGGYRAGDFPEDYELWLRWLEAGVRMAKCAEEVLVWSDPPGRLSRTHPAYSPEAFAAVKAGYLWRWLARHNPRHPRVTVWGAGRVSRRKLEPLLALGLSVSAYVDIDPKKVGQRVHGAPVASRESLPHGAAPDAPFVLANVASVGAREEIRAFLEGRGYRPGAGFILAG